MDRAWMVLALACAAAPPVSARAQACEALAKLDAAGVSIRAAERMGAGTFRPEGSSKSFADLPTFCRVVVELTPTADSDIGAEIWLPLTRWNGKLMAVGSGGWGGAIGYGGMAEALRRGYATSATDDGHAGGSGSFAVGHPEKLLDFAYRAEHAMTSEAKALVMAFYGRPARYAYWNGCSGGGREGLLQAYRYPEEFDGVIAGDPANIRRNAWALWLANETFKDPDARIPSAKYPMIHQYVLDACDARDGLKDGLIADPPICKVGFAGLACKGGDGPACLTARQVKTAETILSPARTARGEVLFPRLEPGTEMRWGRLAGGPAPGDLFLDEYRYVVFQDAQWDWRTFDLDRDGAKAHAVDADVDELDPHLGAFVKHGGKLLIYHGWADQQVAPGSSVEFYESARTLSGASPDGKDWVRLFMVPGMGHCSGGEGPDKFDKIGALEDWVERGVVPEKLLAAQESEGKVVRTRPVCAYPAAPRYRGSGDVNEAASFVCAAR